MSQSRLSSFLEATLGTAIGFVISVALTAVVLPAYGHNVTLSQNLQITFIFTVASIVRSYVLRRWFNAYIHRPKEPLHV
jgi:membrane protein implicated in regulation of membrane protease activity